MGYFSNGSEGMAYEAQYCDKCVHGEECTVWLAHFIANYDECNNKKSILHILIPRSKDGGNGKCTMFISKSHDHEDLKDRVGTHKGPIC